MRPKYFFVNFFKCLPIFLCIVIHSSADAEDVYQLPEDNICAKFTLQFLSEFSPENLNSTLFGWITAEGETSFGQNGGNGTHFRIKCLALALSDWDFIVDRACSMSLAPLNTHRRFTLSQWNQQNDHFNVTDQNVSYIGPLKSDDLNSAQLISFVQKWPNKRATAWPCIFPIDEKLGPKLRWNGTICGLKKTADQKKNSNDSESQKSPQIICHPIELDLENGKVNNHSSEAFRILHAQFQEKSPLYLFEETATNNTFLSAVGTLNESIQFLNKNDCERLAMNSEERVLCADNSNGFYHGIRPYTQEDANAAFLMAPLLILSLLITTGMLITVIAFIVQQKRQVGYNTIN